MQQSLQSSASSSNHQTFDFDVDTSLQRVSVDPPIFSRKLDKTWSNITAVPFGGYLNALIMRSIMETMTPKGFDDPISMHVEFITACGLEDVIEIHVSIEKQGNVYSFVRCVLYTQKKQIGCTASCIIARKGVRQDPLKPQDLHGKRLAVERYRLNEPWKDASDFPDFNQLTGGKLRKHKSPGFFAKLDTRVDGQDLNPAFSKLQESNGNLDEIMDLKVTKYVKFHDNRPIQEPIAMAMLADYGFAINYSVLNYLETKRLETSDPSIRRAVTNSTLGLTMHFLRPLRNRRQTWVRSRAAFSIVGGPINEYEVSVYDDDSVPLLIARQTGWGRMRELDAKTGLAISKSKL